ncbi:UDP-N-acetylglucosamine diphosphorylase/glucosamine-1-phosphate N-acetyltransferase [Arenibacter palladensis]|uniref:UDP-N-acetylglucosamine diphosphorylase/glucosamine-1-phosphate N-acetyltransferase n=1 Tax=Arenibacter palladensis TaxID=237373 RepID=A0A1M4XNK4_9FLAO|nr:GlmU family protein [Arenibacter palladensis]SHE94802.1 UDP-N-acetylglucosamine diphosphorylase/glucosamine-1-phosphate N-acetyltransferase [Arenibacter palladensis]
MNYILFDGTVRRALLPFTFTRPVADIRIGILTIREKWENYLGNTITTITEDYLSERFPMVEMDENVLINASFLPNAELVELVANLNENEAVFLGEEVIAFYSKETQEEVDFSTYRHIEFEGHVLRIENTWDIFSKNGEAMQADFDLLTKGRKSAPISKTNSLVNPENIFLEEGASVEYSILNASEGPIYLGKNSEVWEGNLIRGGFALCEKAVVKMGARIYGPTTVGPYSKVCGEISNSVLIGYSSKGHEGYLGNSVLGEWCNIGADSNNSNLKNNYAKVRLWNYATEKFEQTGLQFCGLMMGDHSKTAINTMFNTGTVIGVNCNIYVPGFPRNFVPSFSWGGASGFTTYQPQKAYEAAKVMMARRRVEFNDMDAKILNHVFEETKRWRKE